jgi:hypothetical protein
VRKAISVITYKQMVQIARIVGYPIPEDHD